MLACFFSNAFVNVAVNESFNNTTLEKVLFYDFSNVFFFNSAVECAFGVDNNNGAESAKTEATCLNNLYFFLNALLLTLFLECGHKHLAA